MTPRLSNGDDAGGAERQCSLVLEAEGGNDSHHGPSQGGLVTLVRQCQIPIFSEDEAAT